MPEDELLGPATKFERVRNGARLRVAAESISCRDGAAAPTPWTVAENPEFPGRAIPGETFEGQPGCELNASIELFLDTG